MSLREGKTGPVTLDLLGGGVAVGPKDLDLGLKPSFGCHGDLRPLVCSSSFVFDHVYVAEPCKVHVIDVRLVGISSPD